ncbi:hypothetical protein GF402_11710 [Candidatus Fermentibacteria bacterium]|nr:hypothetical protein [Candidatus Fermentibacteria bacterium]
MADFWKRLGEIDRRIIFVLIALAVLVPLALKLAFPIPVGKGPSKDFFDSVDSLPPESVVLMSFDYDPSTKPELHPMAIAIVQHLMSTDVNLVAMALWPQGASLAQEILVEISDSLGREQYHDWVNLGYKTGGLVLIARLGSSMKAAFPTDLSETPYGQIPMLDGIQRLCDFDMIITLSAGDPGIPHWVMVASDQLGVPVGGGCTAVSAPQFYPYLQRRVGERPQMEGLLGGLRGAADYEALLRRKYAQAPPGTAIAGMAAQSVAHLVIMVFIVLGNLSYLALRKRKEGQR